MFGLDVDKDQAVETILSKGTQFEGTLNAEESLRLDGQYEGSIQCSGTLIIGASADIEGDIVAQTAIIGGRVNGNISAHEKIEIRKTGEIFGDLTAPVLHIDKGVVLEGSCTINTGGDDSEEAKVTSIKEKLG